MRYLPWLLIAFVITLVLWYWQQSIRTHKAEVEQDFAVSVSHAVELFRERYSVYQNLVFATQGLFNSSERVTGDEWHEFVHSLRIAKLYPGVRSIAFADYTVLGQRDGLIGELHEDDVAELARMRPEQRGFTVRISHHEPAENSSGLLGYDLASEPATLMALRDACAQQRPVMTAAISVPQHGDTIVREVLPVFRKGMPLATELQRHAAMLGWVSVNISIKQWFERFAQDLQSSNLAFSITDESGAVLYNSAVPATSVEYRQEMPLMLGGRTWNIAFWPTPKFEQIHARPTMHFSAIAALLVVLLLILLVRNLQGGQRRAEALAERINEQLRRSEERYREMFEGNQAIELIIDPDDGSIVDANQAAENYYGYSRSELKRMNIADINALSQEELDQEMQRAAEERRNHFLFKHCHATGEIRDVEVHSGPIEVDGKKLLYSIVHDVTERMESERALRESEERYHSIIETTGEGYWLIDVQADTIMEVNDSLCHMLDYSRDELVGRKPSDFVVEGEKGALVEQVGKLPASRQIGFETILRHKDGQSVFVRMNVTALSQQGEQGSHVFAFITDITEWKRTEEQLRIAATFFDTTSEAITVTDGDNKIVAVNPAFSQITGYAEGEALGRDPAFLSSGRNNASFYRNMWQTLERMGYWQGEIWNRRKDGEIYPEWLSIVAIRDDKGEVKQYMAVFSDITKRKKDEEKIWRQANYDGLTDLPNRNLFKDRLNQAMHVAKREGSSIALMFIDLDRFKWVNDTLGHASGDLLLQEAALRLSHSVRETDTVARLGGDEFTVLLNDVHSVADVDRIADLLLRRLSEPFDLEGKEAYVTGSIGITLYPGDADDMEKLLANADAAMYSAKSAGRNVFRYFTQEMNEAAQRRVRLETDLRRVLERDELSVHYQPIVDSRGRVVGAEALLRWNHPEFGAVAPDEFIPLVEEVGVIVPIEQWALETACRDTVKFQQQVDSDFFISVNISSVQCMSGHCRHVLAEVLKNTGLEPQSLKLEITERVMMDNTAHVIDLLQEVKSMGVKLAVDDFGTGYSSLSYLKQFPVDVLKIDRAFIDGLPDDKDDVALVEAIVAMAHSLNLQIVGEGVEKEEQLLFLHSLGCDMVQGFYYSRPIPFDDFITYLKQGGVPASS